MTDQEESKKQIEKSLALLQEGKFQEAEDELYSLLEKFPQSLEGALYLAVAHFNQGEFLEGKGVLIKSLEYHPGQKNLLNSLAQACFRLNETDDALKYILQATQNDPTNAQFHYLKGLILLKKGSVEEGKQTLNHSLSLNPGVALVKKIQRELDQIGKTELKEAPQVEAQPVTPSPNSTAPFPNTAPTPSFELPLSKETNTEQREFLALVNKGDTFGALKKYETLKSFSPETLFFAGVCFLEFFHPHCEHLFLQCIKNGVFPSSAHYNLGLYFQNGNHYSKARNHYLESLKINPEYFPPAFNLGALLLYEGKIEEGRNYFKKLKTQFSNSPHQTPEIQSKIESTIQALI